MTLKKRFILIAVGIIIFLVLAPLVISLARGFRYDFDHNRIIRTGSLVVKTDPRGAEVYLDGKKIKNTPLVKRFLLPKEYFLEIKKAGFHTWKKNITIHPQQVTNPKPLAAEKVYLLFNEVKPEILSTSTAALLEEASFLPVQFKIIDNTLYQVMDNDLQKINGAVQYAHWQEEAATLVYGNENEIWLYRPLDKGASNLLVTRSSQKLGIPVYHKKIGLIFLASNHEIKAIEVTSSGQANTFILAQTQEEILEFKINSEGTELLYLDGSTLVRLKIR